MSFTVDLRIDISTKEMLNITPRKEYCFIKFVSSITKVLASNSKLRKTEIGKELKNENEPCQP